MRLRRAMASVLAMSTLASVAISGCTPSSVPQSATATYRRTRTPLSPGDATATHIRALERVETSVADVRATRGSPSPSPTRTRIITPAFSPTTTLSHSPAPDPCASDPDPSLTVVFTASWDGDREVYSVDLGGSSPAQLTQNRLPDIYPQWSPAASSLAYLAPDSSGDFQVMLLAPQTQSTVQLTRPPHSVATWGYDNLFVPERVIKPDDELAGSAQWLSWSPRGDAIAFMEAAPEYLHVLNVVYLSSGETTEIYSDSFEPFWQYSWSPTGARIVFDFLLDDQGGWGSFLAVALVSSGELQVLRPPDYAEFRRPRWDPLGELLLFLSTAPPPRTTVMISAPDGSQLLPLTDGTMEVTDAAWSPSGQHVAYAAMDPSHIPPTDAQLRVMGRRGDHDTLMVRDSSQVSSRLTWSPDGRFIAYLFGYAEHWDLRALDTCSREVHALAANVDYDAITWVR